MGSADRIRRLPRPVRHGQSGPIVPRSGGITPQFLKV
jgi:hypothetical protein